MVAAAERDLAAPLGVDVVALPPIDSLDPRGQKRMRLLAAIDLNFRPAGGCAWTFRPMVTNRTLSCIGRTLWRLPSAIPLILLCAGGDPYIAGQRQDSGPMADRSGLRLSCPQDAYANLHLAILAEEGLTARAAGAPLPTRTVGVWTKS